MPHCITAPSRRVADRYLVRHGLTDPRFNFREILKQMILTEDHLVHPYKTCCDCIRKHMLTVEALAEEIVSLSPGTGYANTATRLAETSRIWLSQFEDGVPPAQIACRIRAIRKEVAKVFADPCCH